MRNYYHLESSLEAVRPILKSEAARGHSSDLEPPRGQIFLVNTSWALYQLNVLVFWTLVMPVVHKILIKNFLQKLPDFSGTNHFLQFFIE